MAPASITPPLPSFLQSTPAGRLAHSFTKLTISDQICRANTVTSFPLADIHEKFVDLEWQQRNRLRLGREAGSQWAWLQTHEVKERNRYINIDPYDANRVKLKVPEGMNDYINASPIVLKSKSGKLTRYIATQGPKETGVGHMWRMIWHETSSVAVVVMVTQTHDESGHEKCFQYFPWDEENPTLQVNADDEFRDGETATVTLVESTFDEKARCTIRKLRMRVEKQEKIVYHLLFMGWPDFLVPEGEDRIALLELIKLSARLNNEGGDGAVNPRIVHCSAGIGRTGTFIALDHLMEELEVGGFEKLPRDEDLVVETVDALRKQRMLMVQTEGQIRFLYDVLRERWAIKYGG